MRTIYVKALIVKKNGSFLMIRNRKGEWDVPTAITDKKKSHVTVKEAVKKDCGLLVDVIKPVRLATLVKDGKQAFAIIFLCNIKSGTIKLSKDYVASKWVMPEKEEEDYIEVGK